MIGSGHKNTRDDDDDEDLEEGKHAGGLYGLVLLGRTGIVLIRGDERSNVEIRWERLVHLRAEGRPNLDRAVVGSGRARRNAGTLGIPVGLLGGGIRNNRD
jgi:hypothetical protein